MYAKLPVRVRSDGLPRIHVGGAIDWNMKELEEEMLIVLNYTHLAVR